MMIGVFVTISLKGFFVLFLGVSDMGNVVTETVPRIEKSTELGHYDHRLESTLPRFELYVRNINVEFPKFVTAKNETCSKLTVQTRPVDVQSMLSYDRYSDWGKGWGRISVSFNAKNTKDYGNLRKTEAFLGRLRVRKESEDTYLMFDPVTGGVFITDAVMQRIVAKIQSDRASLSCMQFAAKVIEPFLDSV
jgi:hypothetical protein